MLQWYCAGMIFIFLFAATADGQLKEKAEELRLLFENNPHRENFSIHQEIKTLPSAVIDSSLYQEWFLNEWINSESAIYTYNQDLTEEIFIFRRYNNHTWNPEVRTTRYYDNFHNLTHEIVELYDNNNWTFARQKFVVYTDGAATEEIYQDWNGEEWINNSRYTSKYDGNKNQVELLVESWANLWMNNTRYTMLYDNSNNNTLLLAENWIGGWQNLYRTERTYNDSNLLTLQVYYQWEKSRWQPVEKISSSYSIRGELVETKLQLWIEDAWVNELLTTFLYDSLTIKLAEATDQRWNSAASEWLNELHYIYSEADGSTESVVQVWDDKWVNNFRTVSKEEDLLSTTVSMAWDGQNWVNSARSITTYKLITSLKEPAAALSYRLEQNYPNPFNPYTTITYTLPETQPVALKVYNILGEEIITLVNETVPAGKYQVNFNAGGLSSGIYYYRIETKGFTDTRGMILIK